MVNIFCVLFIYREMAALTPVQIAALPSVQIATLPSAQLQPQVIAALTHGQISALTPAQIAVFNDEQKISYSSKKIKFFLENPRVRPISNNDISEYLSSVYSRGGLKTTLNIDKFMASFEPGAVTSGDTSAFCASLFGFRSQLYRKLLARTEDNPRQCKEAGYGKSVGVKCIWCGEWILDFPECEHALPILMAASLLGFSTANADEIEKILEYGSSHRLCNQVKNAIALLKWDSATNEWKIDWRNVRQMYNDITRHGGFANNRMRYELLRNGTPNLLSDNIQEATSPGYQSWSMSQQGDNGRDYDAGSNSGRLIQCNGLSNNGFHRNRPHIQEACRKIAGRITVTPAGSQYNYGNIQVAGSRKKKSKKKKQKGGVFNPAQIQAPTLNNHANLRTYLSQGPDDYTTNSWGHNSVAENNADLYFLARLVAIRDHLNSVNTAMSLDMDKIKMYMICKIVLGPNVDMLIKELGGASPPDPNDNYYMLMKERELLMKDIKRAITDYKKLGPENLLGLRGRITGRRNQIMQTNTSYDELKQLIETRVDDHNLRVGAFQAPTPPKLLDDCKIDIDHETRVTRKLPKFIDWDNEKAQYRTLMAGQLLPGWLDNRIQGGGSKRTRGTEDDEDDGGDGPNSQRSKGTSDLITIPMQKYLTAEYQQEYLTASVDNPRTEEEEEAINPMIKPPIHAVNLPEINYTKPEGYKTASAAKKAEGFAYNVLKPLIKKYASGKFERYQANKDNDYPAYSLFQYLLRDDNKNKKFAELGNIIDELAELREQAREQARILEETLFSSVFGDGADVTQPLYSLPYQLNTGTRFNSLEPLKQATGKRGRNKAVGLDHKRPLMVAGSRKKTSKKANKKANKKTKKLNKRKK